MALRRVYPEAAEAHNADARPCLTQVSSCHPIGLKRVMIAPHCTCHRSMVIPGAPQTPTVLGHAHRQ